MTQSQGDIDWLGVCGKEVENDDEIGESGLPSHGLREQK